jgi:hypothetical protein
MNSKNEFPLDFAGIETNQTPNCPKSREQNNVADLVATVVAIDQSRPIRPRADSLSKIHRTISREMPLTPAQRWIVSSGWAVAAAVTVFFLWKPVTRFGNSAPESQITATPQPIQPPENKAQPVPKIVVAPESTQPEIAENSHHVQKQSVNPRADDVQRKLIQEIEVLRKEVEILAVRDTERLVVQGGVSWPIIMKLTRPGTDPDSAIVQDPLLSAFLDNQVASGAPANNESIATNTTTPSLRIAGVPGNEGELLAQADAQPAVPDLNMPSAVPVYDPARDEGQFIVNNLPDPQEGNEYFLWVQSDKAAGPVLVGTLPNNIQNNESFSFQLGSKGLIPQSFLVTQDTARAPSVPSTANTILQGPQSPPEP